MKVNIIWELTTNFVVLKRWLNISVVVVYALLSIGLQIHLHYCCGKLSKFSLYEPVQGCTSHEDDGDCCLNTDCCQFGFINLKLDDEHQRPTESYASFVPGVMESPLLWESPDECPTSFNHFRSDDDTGPQLPRYLKFHSLILYA